MAMRRFFFLMAVAVMCFLVLMAMRRFFFLMAVAVMRFLVLMAVAVMRFLVLVTVAVMCFLVLMAVTMMRFFFLMAMAVMRFLVLMAMAMMCFLVLMAVAMMYFFFLVTVAVMCFFLRSCRTDRRRAIEVGHIMVMIFMGCIQNDIEITARNAGFLDAGDLHHETVRGDGIQRAFQCLRVCTEVDHRCDEHISADAGGSFKV